MEVQRICNSEALVYRALAKAHLGWCVLRIYCSLYENGYMDVSMKFTENDYTEGREWCMWDENNREWWPVSHWTFDEYEDVRLYMQ